MFTCRPRAGRRRYVLPPVLALALVLSACGVRPGGGDRDPEVLPAGVTAKNLAFQPDLVTVERAGQPVVKATDPDGAGFLLDGSVAGVGQLRVGEVLLVKNELVGRVTELTPTGADMHVRIEAAALTDVFRDGEIVFDELRFDSDQLQVHAWDDPDGVELLPPDGEAEGDAGDGGGGGGAPMGMGRSGKGTTVSAGDYKFEIDFEKVEPSGFDLTIGVTRDVFTAKLDWLGIGDQPSGKVAGTVKVSMRNIAIRGEYRIDDGSLVKGSQHVSFDGTARMSMTAIAGDSAQLAYKDVISIPWETYRTVIVYGVPFLVLVRVKFLVSPAVSGVGTTLMFRTHADFAGSGVHDAASPEPTAEGTGEASNDGQTNRVDGDGFGVAGMVFAVRPRLGLGFGVPGANAMGFGDAVIAAGVVNGSSIGITQCRKLTLDVTVRAGAEAKLFGATVEKAHQLYKNKVYEAVAPNSPACLRLLVGD